MAKESIYVVYKLIRGVFFHFRYECSLYNTSLTHPFFSREIIKQIEGGCIGRLLPKLECGCDIIILLKVLKVDIAHEKY